MAYEGHRSDSNHGHVVQAPDGHIKFAADVERNVYIDEREGGSPLPPPLPPMVN